MKAQGTHVLRRPTSVKDTEKIILAANLNLDTFREELQMKKWGLGFLKNQKHRNLNNNCKNRLDSSFETKSSLLRSAKKWMYMNKSF